MHRRNLAIGAAGALSVAAAARPAAAATRQQVVYHVGDEGGPDHEHWRVALGNMNNHLDAAGPDGATIACVLNWTGVRLLVAARQDQALGQAVATLRQRGVRFLVCNNSLRGLHLERAQLLDVPEGDIVPAGVVALAGLQAEGYAYIRP